MLYTTIYHYIPLYNLGKEKGDLAVCYIPLYTVEDQRTIKRDQSPPRTYFYLTYSPTNTK